MNYQEARAAMIAALEARATAIAAILTKLDGQLWGLEPNPERYESATIRAVSGDGLRVEHAARERFEIISIHPDRALYQYTFHDDAYTTRITVSAQRTDQVIATDIYRRLLPDARAQRAALSQRKAAADDRAQRRQSTIAHLSNLAGSQPYGHDKHCISLRYQRGASGTLQVNTDSSIEVRLDSLTEAQAVEIIQLIQQFTVS